MEAHAAPQRSGAVVGAGGVPQPRHRATNAAIALAVVLHVVVERPVRRLQTPWWPTFAGWLAAGAALTIAAFVAL